MMPIRFAIFASGTGSNAEALMKHMSAFPEGRIEFVLSDQRDAAVLSKALKHGVPSYLLEKVSDRTTHEQEILKILDRHQVDWILLAGYMRLLSAKFLKEVGARHNGLAQVVNIHPSLLPQYPGANSLERAFNDKVLESGVTLHLVDEGMDTGPIIQQTALQLHSAESLADFKSRMHVLEHQVYCDFVTNVLHRKVPTQFYKEVIEC